MSLRSALLIVLWFAPLGYPSAGSELFAVMLHPRRRHIGAWAVSAMVLVILAWSPWPAQGQPPVCTGTQQTLNFTGVATTFTVPPFVTQLTIDAAGAAGGDSNPNFPGLLVPGGRGARVVASFAVTPSETLNIVVGGAGGPAGVSAGGGGGSFVYRTATPSGLLIAAAGGGGASPTGAGLPGNATATAASGQSSGGGIGGAAGTGGNGGGAGSGVFCGGAGGGGLLTNGGDQASCDATGGQALANGAAGGAGDSDPDGSDGGFGGGGGGSGLLSDTTGAGGGGGFNGGGGGAGPLGAVSGGGGGSFSATALIFSQSGAQTGNGRVSFCYTPNSAASIPTLGAWAFLLLALLLVLIAVRGLRMRRTF